jgi:hypothetical protein
MRIVALVVLALLTPSGVAMAKGPLSGSVSGPGLAAPIKLDGTGEWDEDSPLALLTANTGIYDHSKHPPRPAGELGPRYDVRLVFPRHSTGKPDNSSGSISPPTPNMARPSTPSPASGSSNTRPPLPAAGTACRAS